MPPANAEKIFRRLISDRVNSDSVGAMSAFGPKQTWASVLQMSAFGGKADMTSCENPLSRLLLGVKRTLLFAAHMSAYDPKQEGVPMSANDPKRTSSNGSI